MKGHEFIHSLMERESGGGRDEEGCVGKKRTRLQELEESAVVRGPGSGWTTGEELMQEVDHQLVELKFVCFQQFISC